MATVIALASAARPDEKGKLNALAVEMADYIRALELSQRQALQEIAPTRMEAFSATFGQLRGVQRALVKLVSALRAELNLARDDNEFMEQLKDMERRAWAAVSKAYGIDPPGPMPEIVEQVEPVRPSHRSLPERSLRPPALSQLLHLTQPACSRLKGLTGLQSAPPEDRPMCSS